MNNVKAGYYTVMIDTGTNNIKIPYQVFASSDFHAAKIVKEETGYLVTEHDVDGPHVALWK